MAHVSSLTIEEVELEGGATPRRVTLRGGGLPKMGEFPITGKQRVKTRFPIGNPEGTQHVLGPTEAPGSISGEWHHGMLLAAPCTIEDDNGVRRVTQPVRLMSVLEDMIRGGALLRVTWATRIHVPLVEDIKYVREGRATSYDFRPDTLEDVKWTIDFEWIGRGETPPQAILNEDFYVNAEDMLARSDAALDVVMRELTPQQGVGLPPRVDALTTASRWTDRVLSGMRRFQNTARRLNDTVQRVLAVRNQVAKIASTGVAISADYVALCTRTHYEFQRTPTELSVARLRAGDVARATKAVYTQEQNLTSVTNAALRALKAERAVWTQAASGALATSTSSAAKRFYKTIIGDSPPTVSSKFFGTPDRAVDILKANRLSVLLTEFVPGTLLILPKA